MGFLLPFVPRLKEPVKTRSSAKTKPKRAFYIVYLSTKFQ